MWSMCLFTSSTDVAPERTESADNLKTGAKHRCLVVRLSGGVQQCLEIDVRYSVPAPSCDIAVEMIPVAFLRNRREIAKLMINTTREKVLGGK